MQCSFLLYLTVKGFVPSLPLCLSTPPESVGGGNHQAEEKEIWSNFVYLANVIYIPNLPLRACAWRNKKTKIDFIFCPFSVDEEMRFPFDNNKSIKRSQNFVISILWQHLEAIVFVTEDFIETTGVKIQQVIFLVIFFVGKNEVFYRDSVD